MMKRVMLLISILLFSFLAIYARSMTFHHLSDEEIKEAIEDVVYYGKHHPEAADAIRRYARADKQLNAAYKMLMDIYERLEKESGSNAENDKKALQSAQLAWIKYRDLAVESELAFHTNSNTYDCFNSMADLTEQRIARMKSMLKNMSDYFGSNDPKENPAKLALDKLEKMKEEDEKKESR